MENNEDEYLYNELKNAIKKIIAKDNLKNCRESLKIQKIHDKVIKKTQQIQEINTNFETDDLKVNAKINLIVRKLIFKLKLQMFFIKYYRNKINRVEDYINLNNYFKISLYLHRCKKIEVALHLYVNKSLKDILSATKIYKEF